MDTHRVLLAFPEAFDVVDIEHPNRLDWRRCRLSFIETTNGRVALYIKVRNKATGRGCHALFEGVFGAAIESLVRTILSKIPSLSEPSLIGPGFLYRGGNRAHSQGKGSALFSYQMPNYVADAILQLNGHMAMHVLQTAQDLAQHQARIRNATLG